jgi:hypothetical protein
MRTGPLLNYLLLMLRDFPPNWGRQPGWRKLYKCILRVVLLVLHDAPDLIGVRFEEVVGGIPFSFRKLRNVLLSCSFKRLFDQAPIPYFDELAQGKRPAADGLRACRAINVHIQVFIDYLFRFYVDPQRKEVVKQTVVWRQCFGMLEHLDGYGSAMLVLESIMDQLRTEGARTSFFVDLVFALYETELEWDRVSAKDIIFSGIMQRTTRVAPVPVGAVNLRKRLERLDSFQTMVLSYQKYCK